MEEPGVDNESGEAEDEITYWETEKDVFDTIQIFPSLDDEQVFTNVRNNNNHVQK